jgi:hypothetical protein
MCGSRESTPHQIDRHLEHGYVKLSLLLSGFHRLRDRFSFDRVRDRQPGADPCRPAARRIRLSQYRGLGPRSEGISRTKRNPRCLSLPRTTSARMNSAGRRDEAAYTTLHGTLRATCEVRRAGVARCERPDGGHAAAHCRRAAERQRYSAGSNPRAAWGNRGNKCRPARGRVGAVRLQTRPKLRGRIKQSQRSTVERRPCEPPSELSAQPAMLVLQFGVCVGRSQRADGDRSIASPSLGPSPWRKGPISLTSPIACRLLFRQQGRCFD